MNRPFISPDLLQRYLSGVATAPEKETVDAWYALLRGQPDFLNTLTDEERTALQAETYQMIRARLTTDVPDNVRPLPVPVRSWYRRSWAVAGGLAASILLVVWVGLRVSEGPLLPKPQASVATPPAFIRLVNQQPRLLKQQLPDGTVVWLHPRAELSYPRVFAGQQRAVQFAGEAFFEVAKDPRRPFRIQSGTLQIQVLGTSFNVRVAPGQARFEVAVVTGKVQVRSLKKTGQSPAQAVLLGASQAVRYDVATARLTRQQPPEQARRAIYEPVSIAFTDAPVGSVLRQLEARFNVRVRVANPALANCRLTADFANQALPVILEQLCASLDATYTMTNETITLAGDGCQ